MDGTQRKGDGKLLGELEIEGDENLAHLNFLWEQVECNTPWPV